MNARILVALLFLVMSAPSVQAQSSPPPVKTTAVLVMLRAKTGVTWDQIKPLMPSEIRATTQLYLNGKIRDWYSRGDGRGVLFIFDTPDVAEARAIMEGLPLSKENLMEAQYIPVGPLLPLGLLLNQ